MKPFLVLNVLVRHEVLAEPYEGYAGQHLETEDLVEWRTIMNRRWGFRHFGESVYKAGYGLQEAIERGKTLGEAEK